MKSFLGPKPAITLAVATIKSSKRKWSNPSLTDLTYDAGQPKSIGGSFASGRTISCDCDQDDRAWTEPTPIAQNATARAARLAALTQHSVTGFPRATVVEPQIAALRAGPGSNEAALPGRRLGRAL
jgi:hypothetical protein